MTRVVIFYMLLMAALAAFFLGTAPIELWVRLVLAGFIVGIEIGIPLSAAVVRLRRTRNQRRRYLSPD